MNDKLIWIDLEMSGLDPERHVILEIASLITSPDLDVLAKGPLIAIHHSENILASMEKWSREHHESSGLLKRVRLSHSTVSEAEQETLAFLKHHVKDKASPLCGNSIWQDRRFLCKYMPMLEAFFHYRIIDVSSIKELFKRWYPNAAPFKKAKSHEAMKDIEESVAELRYYRKNLFK